jgi:hypothetical protein
VNGENRASRRWGNAPIGKTHWVGSSIVGKYYRYYRREDMCIGLDFRAFFPLYRESNANLQRLSLPWLNSDTFCNNALEVYMARL